MIPIREEESPFETQPEANVESKSKLEKEESITCQYHLGYLGEREQKQQIPDDCLVCKEIVECMLKRA